MIKFEEIMKTLNKEGWTALTEYNDDDVIVLIGRINPKDSNFVEIKWIDKEGKEYSEVTSLDINVIKSINKVLLEK